MDHRYSHASICCCLCPCHVLGTCSLLSQSSCTCLLILVDRSCTLFLCGFFSSLSTFFGMVFRIFRVSCVVFLLLLLIGHGLVGVVVEDVCPYYLHCCSNHLDFCFDFGFESVIEILFGVSVRLFLFRLVVEWYSNPQYRRCL